MKTKASKLVEKNKDKNISKMHKKDYQLRA